ncbi:hypothetical protein DFQ28_002926 [Apophysomyces sp. BC1034]|nr:hypothetical protein DFQ30_003254 [Apophysomyces sp. BC1015]KAG0189766.1 hypothetical protein DFQ28_002926 [Apophysomyces sp. BC1034]
MPAIQKAPEPPITPKNLVQIKLSDINELELARRLCLLDFKLYSSIRNVECLDKAWSSDFKEKSQKPTAVNVIKSIGYCNKQNKWVISSILASVLSSEEPKERVAVWKYWIYVADVSGSLPTDHRLTRDAPLQKPKQLQHRHGDPFRFWQQPNLSSEKVLRGNRSRDMIKV